MKHQTIKVEGMTCNHCKSSVESALNRLDGVDSAIVSLEDNQVTVQYDDSRIDSSELNAVIEEQGYDIEK
ncbi:copper chaperone CopZ [Salinicoccus sesuvii]|uniref:Copper chaperone CopZ n=1 Tax=Salinicoccus sesuvii TaxID=868281 RepID=A0ABV7N3R7_9STAP